MFFDVPRPRFRSPKFPRRSIGRVAPRLARRRLARVETLEDRRLLAVFNPSPAAPDGDANSLRAAVIAANANGADDVIMLAAGAYVLTLNNIAGQENAAQVGDLDLLEDGGQTIVFRGAGRDQTTIDANAAGSPLNDRVFQLIGNVTVVFEDLTIRGGTARDNGEPGDVSAGESLGGGILMRSLNQGPFLGRAALNRANLVENRALGAAGTINGFGRSAHGGGVYSDGGDLTVIDSAILDNQAVAGAGGASGTFGGAATGGGVFVANADLTVSGSQILDNQAIAGRGGNATGNPGLNFGGFASGGGVFASEAAVNVAATEIAGNVSRGGDGGDFSFGGFAEGGGISVEDGTLNLTNAAIHENTAQAGDGDQGLDGFGGFASGGGVYLESFGAPTETIFSVTAGSNISDNAAFGGHGTFGGFAEGGGGAVAGAGMVLVSDAVVNGNQAVGGDGTGEDDFAEGGFAFGGGLVFYDDFDGGPLAVAIDRTTIAANEARGGNGADGGVFIEIIGGEFPSLSSTGLNGAAGGDAFGGGLYSGLDAASQLFVGNSTFAGNHTFGGDGGAGGDGNNAAGHGGAGGSARGGAVYTVGDTRLNVLNSTLSSNSALGGGGGAGGAGTPDDFGQTPPGGIGGSGGRAEGGGLYIGDRDSVSSTSETNLLSATVARNTVADAPGGAGGSGAPAGSAGLAGIGAGGGVALGFTTVPGVLRTQNTLIGDNTAGSGAADFHGRVAFANASLFETPPSGGIAQAGPVLNLLGVDPQLGPLQNNGGPTQTHAILAGSPALDAGIDPAQSGQDQRFFARPVDLAGVPNAVNGDGSDIGAFESQNPVAADDGQGPSAPLFRTDEDSAFTTGNVLANDIDLDGDLLTIVDVDVSQTLGVLTPNGDGTFEYDPNNQFGFLNVGESDVDLFSYTVSDGQGGFDTATVTITIMGVNDPPLAANDAFTINEDTPTTLPVLANDVDVDNTDLTIAILSPPANGTANVVGNAVDYAPNADFFGDDSFTYTVSDGAGGTDTASVTITVLPVPDPPAAINDAAATDEDTPITISVLANDFDVDGDSISLVSVNGDQTAGTLTVGPNGMVTYDPDDQFEFLGQDANDVDVFTYTITDGQFTATATVTVTVLGVNDAPLAVPDPEGVPPAQFQTSEDAVLNSGANLLANDFDLEGDPLSVTPSNTTSAQGAAVATSSSGTFTYDPTGAAALQALAAGESLADTFTYTITDGDLTSAPATVTITVLGANDAPVAQPDAFPTNEDTEVTLAPDLLLDNDADVDASDVLSILAIDAQNTIGLVTPLANGAVRYDPRGRFDALRIGETATDTFAYTLSDGRGGIATATVTITIQGVNDLPVAVPGGPFVVPEGGSAVLNGSQGEDAEPGFVTFQWDLDGDGVFGEPSTARGPENVQNPAFLASDLDGPLEIVVQLRVVDAAAGVSPPVTTIVQVANVAPSLPDICELMRTRVGRPLTFQFEVFDPALSDTITYYIDWNANGVIEPSQGEVVEGAGHELEIAHTFDRPQHYFVRYVAVDDDHGSSLGIRIPGSTQGRIPQINSLLPTVPLSHIFKGLVTAAEVPSDAWTDPTCPSGNDLASGPPPDDRPEDVNRDGRVALDDLLAVVSAIRLEGVGPARNLAMDANRDGWCGIDDMLQVAQYLRNRAAAAADTPEPERPFTGDHTTAPEWVSPFLLDQDDDKAPPLAESVLETIAQDVAASRQEQ